MLNIKNLMTGMLFHRIFPILSLLIILGCSATRNSADGNISVLNEKEFGKYTVDSARWSKAALNFFISGSKNEQQGNYSGAILEYLDALVYDSSATIYFAIGKNYKSLYKLDNAKKYTLEAINRNHNFTEAWELLATIYVWEYKTDEAIKCYDELLKINPKTEYSYSLGRLYEIKDPRKAIKIYEDLLDNHSEKYLMDRLSILYAKIQDSTGYLKTLEKLYNDSQDDAANTFRLIAAYLYYKDFNKAEIVINKLDSRLPASELSSIYNMLEAQILEDSSREVENFIPVVLNKIDGRFYFDWKIQFVSGLLSQRIKDSAHTEKFYIKALISGDTVPGVPLQLSSYYMLQKQYYKAVLILNEFSIKYPDDYRFPFYCGLAYLSLDSSGLAVNKFIEALKKDSSKADLWTQLGYAYDKAGNETSSDEAYERALTIDPNDPTANNNYSYTLSLRNKDLPRALKMIESAMKSEPNNPSFLDTYGWIQFQMGNLQVALDYVKRAAEKNETGSEVFEHLGDIYDKLGEKNSAVDAWKKGLKIDPNNKKLLDRLKELE